MLFNLCSELVQFFFRIDPPPPPVALCACIKKAEGKICVQTQKTTKTSKFKVIQTKQNRQKKNNRTK